MVERGYVRCRRRPGAAPAIGVDNVEREIVDVPVGGAAGRPGKGHGHDDGTRTAREPTAGRALLKSGHTIAIGVRRGFENVAAEQLAVIVDERDRDGRPVVLPGPAADPSARAILHAAAVDAVGRRGDRERLGHGRVAGGAAGEERASPVGRPGDAGLREADRAVADAVRRSRDHGPSGHRHRVISRLGAQTRLGIGVDEQVRPRGRDRGRRVSAVHIRPGGLRSRAVWSRAPSGRAASSRAASRRDTRWAGGRRAGSQLRVVRLG